MTTDLPAARGNPPALSRGALFLLFAVSGFAGLIYESIWSHYLKLFLGHAAYAQTLVLALFMGGMAIGAGLCSRLSLRWPNLLRGYALAEAAIGVAALAFHPLFTGITGLAYDSLLPGLHEATGSELATAALKWLLAALLILPQSVLLGMTFPLMSAGILRRHPQAPGATLAMLYFTNSLGAAIGVLASGFVMIGYLGLPGTIMAAGALNLVLAAIVWVGAPGTDPRPATTGPAAGGMPADPAVPEAPWNLLLAIAFFTGAASFIYEIGWIRMLALVLGSSTHAFELMLSAFILGLACGGLWVRKRIDRVRDPVRLLALVQVAMGLLALATLPLYGQMFPLMQAVLKGLAKSDTGYALFLLASHGISLAIMFPASFCAGMTLPLITYVLLRNGHGERAIGAVYGANTLGSIAGVFAAAHLGMPLLGLKGLISAGAALDVLLGLALLWLILPGDGRRGRVPALATALALGAFALVLGAVQLDPYRMASGVFRRGELFGEKDVQLVYYKDGKTTSVSLLDFGTARSLRTNGKSDGAIEMGGGEIISDEITMTLTGALPLALRPEARVGAVIGVGTGLTTHTLLSHPGIERIDTVEIEPAMAEASRLFAPLNVRTFADPRSNIVFDDAKTYFSTHNRRYDFIVSEPSNPWVSGVSSLFTAEFYALVKRYLKPGGVLVQWLQLYETDLSLVASVLGALGSQFPDYVIHATADGDLLIAAGDSAAVDRPLADLTAIAGPDTELARVRVHNLGDLEIRRIGSRAALEPLFASYSVPANSDFHPFLDLHAARYRYLGESASALTMLGTAGIPVVEVLEGRTGGYGSLPSLDGEDHFEKLFEARRARYALEYLLQGRATEPPTLSRNLQKDLEVIRLRLLECRDPQQHEIWLHALYNVARNLNALLPKPAVRQLWERVQRTTCFAGLNTRQRSWIALFGAVGDRDAARMAELAEAMLDVRDDLPAGHRQYLLAAALAGRLALGQRTVAAAVLQRHDRDYREEDLGLRLLRAHLHGAQPKTAR